jgi:hypothetical protein
MSFAGPQLGSNGLWSFHPADCVRVRMTVDDTLTVTSSKRSACHRDQVSYRNGDGSACHREPIPINLEGLCNLVSFLVAVLRL